MSMNLSFCDLQFLVDKEADAAALLRRAVETGRRVQAYSGLYWDLHYGNLQIVAGVVPNPETGSPEVLSGHCHSAGIALWQCRVRQEITRAGSSGLDMRLLVEPVDGGKGYTVIDVISADILPSYAPGEIIELQVIAKTHNARFYTDAESYFRANEQERMIPPRMKEASRPLREGYPMPLGFLCREEPAVPGIGWMDSGLERENLVYVRGTIEGQPWYSTKLPDHSGCTVKRHMSACRIMTDFGPLHAMLPARFSDPLRNGRTISLLCSLQGDALIGEYDDGMVVSMKNNLMALRYAFSSGRMKRLLPVLAENCEVFSETGERAAAGRESVVRYLEGCYEKLRRGGGVYTLYGSSDTGADRCVVVGQGDEAEGKEALLVSLQGDREEKICCIRLRAGGSGEMRKYRSWLEMEEDDLVREGISPAILWKEKAFADFLNRTGPRDVMTDVVCSILDEDVVLEFGQRRVEGRDRVLEYLEKISKAVSAEEAFRARPVFMSNIDGLSYIIRPADTAAALALISSEEKNAVCFFLADRKRGGGRVNLIRGAGGEGCSWIIDYYGEWDPLPDGVKTRICRRERTE